MSEKDSEIPESVTFHFIKSTQFRAIHADGVWGGVTPRGTIAMTFFSQRGPVPRQVTHAVSRDGKVGDEIPDLRVTKEGIIRELEVTAIMDVNMAKSVVKWLNQKIEAVEEAKKGSDQ